MSAQETGTFVERNAEGQFEIGAERPAASA